MCVGIALAAGELPLEMLSEPRVQARLFARGGEPEVRFFFRDRERLLPVLHEGTLRLVRWGAKRSESKVLPPTGWTWLSSVEGGQWGQIDAVPVFTFVVALARPRRWRLCHHLAIDTMNID
jgi:hypothetical protein